MKSWNEIRKAATAFSKRWKNAYDEKAQAQSLLKEFFAVFDVDRARPEAVGVALRAVRELDAVPEPEIVAHIFKL